MFMVKLFGGGKKDKKKGFYMELDESQESKTTEGAVAAPPKPEAEKEAEATEEKKAEATEEKKAEVVEEKKAEATEEKKAKPVKAKKTTSKKKPVKKEAPSAPVTASSSQPAPDAPEWVKAMYKSSSNGKTEKQEDMTFAPDNLMPIPTKSRRKPGPSMGMFMKMAREAKTPMFKK